jgi:hypothetical protein
MAAARRGQRGEDVEGPDEADDEGHDPVEVVDVELAHAGLALHAPGADHRGHAEHHRQQHPDPDVLDVLEVPLDGRAAVVAGQPEGEGPDEDGDEIDDGEHRRRHAHRAAGGGDHDAEAERPAAGQEHPDPAALGQIDPLRVFRAGALAALHPRAAAGAGGAVVHLVARHGGRHGHGDDEGRSSTPRCAMKAPASRKASPSTTIPGRESGSRIGPGGLPLSGPDPIVPYRYCLAMTRAFIFA